jgi:hypothetical protein
MTVLIIGAGVSTLFALGLFWQTPKSDFLLFYQNGQAWLHGHPLYQDGLHNLNPPLVVGLLFAPLATLPLPLAKAVWLLLNLAAFAVSLLLVSRELKWTWKRALQVAAMVLVTYPAFLAWSQYVWLLTLPATLSWRAARQERLTAAGLWFAPVIALKPPLALVAIFFPWRICLAAAAGSASVTVLGIVWTGLEPWRDWWHYRDAVAWLFWPDNVSLWGQAGRFLYGYGWHGRLADLPWWMVALILVGGLAGWFLVQRERDPDRRYAWAWLSGVLLSPLGWSCYLVIGWTSLAASWCSVMRLPWLLLCVPFYAFAPFAEASWMWLPGSLYTAAVLLAWTRFLASPHDQTEQHHEDYEQRKFQRAI